MPFFNFFSSKDSSPKTKEKPLIPWIPLNRVEQLDEIVALSQESPVLIFKYSTTCGVSRIALQNFERDLTLETDKIKLYFLDLLAFRDVSNEIAHRFRVTHQSPQVIMIKNGSPVYNASHHYIDATDLLPLIT